MGKFSSVLKSTKHKNVEYNLLDSDIAIYNIEKILASYFSYKTINRAIERKEYLKRYAGDDKFINMVAGESLLHWFLSDESKIPLGKGISISNSVKFPQGFDAFGIDGKTLTIGEAKSGKYDYAIKGIQDDLNKFYTRNDEYAVLNFISFLKDEKNISKRRTFKLKNKYLTFEVMFWGLALFESTELTKKTYIEYFDEQISKRKIKYDDSKINKIVLMGIKDFVAFKHEIWKVLNYE